MKKEMYLSKPEPLIKHRNYDAIECTGWLNSDNNNLQSWANQLFRNDVNINGTDVQEVRDLADRSLTSMAKHIKQLQKILKEYEKPQEN